MSVSNYYFICYLQVADSGPVHGVVHYAAVPQVQYVPLAPTGVVLSGQQAAAPVAAPQPTFVAG